MGRIAAVLLLVVAAIVYVAVQLVRPVPAISASAAGATTAAATMPGALAPLAWPGGGEAAIGVEGVGLLDAHGSQSPTPLGSVAKIMTAYVVLHDHPLSTGASGPTITVTPTDVTVYRQDLAASDSVVAVTAGEQLSELQVLEGLLIPSGDNLATLLADWDAGSLPAFVAKMNATARQLGLSHTHYADASGVAAGTVSTAADQVRLAMAAMEDPVFRTIVGMPQVTLPVVGLQYNVDALIGKDGIVGVKTGFTTQAGGCFVFAADVKVSGRTTTQPSALTAAFDATTALLTSVVPALEQSTAIRAGETLGQLHAPWASPVALQATRAVTLTGLAGQKVHSSVVLPSHVSAPVAAHTHFGTAIVSLGAQAVRVPLATSVPLPAASLTWRLTNL
jgi:D-alanyl-D-alanine carboxypeptidase (penicillin-binding protein 5/6)